VTLANAVEDSLRVGLKATNSGNWLTAKHCTHLKNRQIHGCNKAAYD